MRTIVRLYDLGGFPGNLIRTTVETNGRLFMMPPLVCQEFSGAGFRFSRVAVWFFVHIGSSEDIMG